MFSESQMKAIEHERGPAMVLAGPGTGKTTVITHRVKRLIEKGLAKPNNILVVTFTKAAAREMEERFENLMGENNDFHKVCFGTFHSVFYQMLRRSGMGLNEKSVLTDNERYRILREIIMRLKLDTNDVRELVGRMADEISRAKGGYLHNEKFKSEICSDRDFERVYGEYEKTLKAEQKIDFEDMILKCNQMLRENSHILEFWQNMYSFILVDEFQDINQIQYDNIKLLGESRKNIFIVGDDDQSIYGFRGAGPELMFQFEKDFHKTTVIRLKENFRSPVEILNVADNLISHNSKRYSKNLVARKENEKAVDIREFENNVYQYEYMAKRIKDYMSSGMFPEQIAILVRNNDSIPIIRNFMRDRSIQAYVRKKESIYTHPIARDVVAYVQAAREGMDVPIFDNQALAAIINKPERYISRQVIKDGGCSLKNLEKVYEDSKEILKNIKELEMHLMMIRRLDPYAAVNYIQHGTGYDRYVYEYAKQKGAKYEELVAVLGKIRQDASRFSTVERWLKHIEEGECDSQSDNTGRGIQIITMHASKGLEFPVVFLPDVNQGVIPGMKAIRDCDLAEERRVFYVAVTRASEYLHIYSPKQVMGRKCQVSQFVNEMRSCLHF